MAGEIVARKVACFRCMVEFLHTRYAASPASAYFSPVSTVATRSYLNFGKKLTAPTLTSSFQAIAI
jgi:hypothetical protein